MSTASAPIAQDIAYVLVLNSGSSSIKFQILDPTAHATDTPLVSGLVERIGEEKGSITIKTGGEKITEELPIPDHAAGLDRAVEILDSRGVGPTQLNIVAVGHRVVHGGAEFSAPALIDDATVESIRDIIPLAPLHNPAHISGMEEARRLLPEVPHVAVFDTAFFRTIPDAANRYAINKKIADEYGIRRYGFHGTSHEYVSQKVATFLDRPLEELNQITLHLGNGCSATAIKGGKAVDTSMGLTPLAGLVMGSRCGDIDPSIVFHLRRSAGMTVDEMDTLFNRDSGLKGVSGVNDFRALQEAIDAGNQDAILAYDIYVHTLRRFIGSYLLILGGVDTITFTAGVGENHVGIRRDSLAGLEKLGIIIDEDRNENKEGIEGARIISSDDSAVTVLVVPTNEELAIARYALEFVA